MRFKEGRLEEGREKFKGMGI